MPRFKEHDYSQGRFLSVDLGKQIQPGTFEYTVSHLIDHQIDLSVFDSKYRNDETGAPAFDPAVLLKIILVAYSRGMVSSRKIARACEENVLFIALTADSAPHFTTIADFVATMGPYIVPIFREVLAVCYAEGLIGKRMFAVDGCKISSNCSKEWSGSKAELRKKAEKIEKSVKVLLDRQRTTDAENRDENRKEQEKKAVEHLQEKAKKIREWLSGHEDRIGVSGKPVKSNITDNESAKMPGGHGVVQGYNGLATVDDKHQVVVDAQAFGEGTEASNLQPVLESVQQTFEAVDGQLSIFDETVLTADSGFHTEESVEKLLENKIDAYVPDRKFRLRDPRYADLQEHKSKTVDRKRTSKARKYFTAEQFHFDSTGTLICPAGKPMKSSCPNWKSSNGYTGKTFRGFETECRACPVREKCLRNLATKVRQVTKIDKGTRNNTVSATQRMIERFDTDRGRYFYSRRMGTVEPVFANIVHTMGMNRFTLRGRSKVDTQWKLYCMVHNIGKIARYGSTR
jgi:transposase